MLVLSFLNGQPIKLPSVFELTQFCSDFERVCPLLFSPPIPPSLNGGLFQSRVRSWFSKVSWKFLFDSIFLQSRCIFRFQLRVFSDILSIYWELFHSQIGLVLTTERLLSCFLFLRSFWAITEVVSSSIVWFSRYAYFTFSSAVLPYFYYNLPSSLPYSQRSFIFSIADGLWAVVFWANLLRRAC